MATLSILEWLLLAENIVTTSIVLMFVFGLLFSLLRGGKG